MKRFRPALGIGLLGLLMASCMTPVHTTQVKTITKDPQFHPGQYRRRLVIGVFPAPERRKMFENAFAKQLDHYKGKTVCSHNFFPTLTGIGRPQIEALVKDQKIDAVYITRLVSTSTIQTEMQGHTQEVPSSPMDGAVSYFTEGSTQVTGSGYSVDQTVAVLETKVFETEKGVCVWTCRSDTLINGTLDELIRSYVWVMTQSLYASD